MMKNRRLSPLSWMTILVFFTFLTIHATTLTTQYSQKSIIYWVFKKQGQGYRLNLDKAKEGIRLDDKEREITFRMLLSEEDYKQLIKNPITATLQIEWYRYNRAKPSIFNLDKINLAELKPFKYEEDNKLYYRVSSLQKEILTGTWVVKISDSQNNQLKLHSESEFDIIVL